MKILVTGAAGFIGYHLVAKLLERGDDVVGIDNINDYYSVNLKYARLFMTGIAESEIDYGKVVESSKYENYKFIKCDLTDKDQLSLIFSKSDIDVVVNLAAQAGVRYSIDNPFAYIESNIVGFANILECCRHNNIKHLVYASSSSVYGGNTKIPFSENDVVDNPVSLYAATKKSNELMASCYSKLYGIPATGLRFFTVYGPWGRPDMAPMLFAKAITCGQPIKVFNNGDMMRDFTYIDDIVEGTMRVIDNKPSMSGDNRQHEIYNIGCSNPVKLMDFISILEDAIGKKTDKVMLPMQPGDVAQTYADTSKLETAVGYKPATSLKKGIEKFADWYKNYCR